MALAAVGFGQYWSDSGPAPPTSTLALSWVSNSPWVRIIVVSFSHLSLLGVI